MLRKLLFFQSRGCSGGGVVTLIGSLIDETVDSSSDLAQILRKASILASELRSPELAAWAKAELDGYGREDALPDYREFSATNLGSFIGPTMKATSLPIALSSVPSEWHEYLRRVELRSGVSELQDMYRATEQYVEQWPADAIAAVATSVYEGMNMYRAWKALPKAKLALVLDSVRNRLLRFLLELKERFPKVEDSQDALRSLPTDEVRLQVINNIYGDRNVVATGETVTQSVQERVEPGDLDSLMEALSDARVPDELLRELREAIDEDSEAPVDGGVGPKVASWLSRLAGRVATNSATTIATQAIWHVYGVQ
ncbi:MAG: hypothetical protein IIC32_01785 [Chloroflexi bacterium]|nr:hypothetical protein [Chloroflexota bacterium]